jgi:hypothetical protein
VKPGIVAGEAPPQGERKGKERNGAAMAATRLPASVRQGLLKELPKAGTVWDEDQRKLWLDTAASIFKMIYKDDPLK